MEKAQRGIMRSRNEAKTFSMGDNTVTFHITGEETGGRYSLTEFIMAAPPAPGPPMHIHELESEATYVLEGELLFMLGERSMKASTGYILFVPKGTKHTLSNFGPGITRILVILTPAGFEKFWEEMANLLKVSGGKPDPAHVLSLTAKVSHGYRWKTKTNLNQKLKGGSDERTRKCEGCRAVLHSLT